MARFNVRNLIASSITKEKELNAAPTAGNYDRFDEGDNVWLDGNGQRPEQRVPSFENNSAREKLISDALDRRAAYMKEKFGVEMKGSFRPRTAEEVAALANTCFAWLEKAEGSDGRNPALAADLAERVAALAKHLKSVVGFRVCRGLLRQSLSAVTRAAGVTPELSKKLRVMDSRGPSRNADEQEKRDRLVDSVEESVGGLRCMIDLGRAVERASEEVGLKDFRGSRVKDLELGVELLTTVIGLEMGSRKGQVRFSMGGYLPQGAGPQALEDHKAALAAAYRKVEAGEAALAKEVALLVEMPKKVYRDSSTATEAAVRALDVLMAATFATKAGLTIQGETMAEKTGKAVSGGGGGMFEKEIAACERALRQTPYQAAVRRVVDEDGNVINPNAGIVLPNTGRLNTAHVARKNPLPDLTGGNGEVIYRPMETPVITSPFEQAVVDPRTGVISPAAEVEADDGYEDEADDVDAFIAAAEAGDLSDEQKAARYLAAFEAAKAAAQSQQDYQRKYWAAVQAGDLTGGCGA